MDEAYKTVKSIKNPAVRNHCPLSGLVSQASWVEHNRGCCSLIPPSQRFNSHSLTDIEHGKEHRGGDAGVILPFKCPDGQVLQISCHLV